MLKYLNIIQQLSYEDKVRILCDIELLSDKKYRVMGIPSLQIVSLEQFCSQELPSPVALANSWDPDLVEKTAHHRFRAMAEQGVDVAIIPGPKLKINPCRSALSEDDLLACAIVKAYLRSASQFGISVLLDDFCIRADELPWLDTQPDERMLRELLVQPYQNLAGAAACKGVLTAMDLDQPGWTSVNTQLCRAITAEKDLFFLCSKVSAKNTVTHIQNGGLCFQASSVALEAALERYRQLADQVAHGSATAEELAQEVAQGKAISPEAIDEATDRLLRLLFAAKRKPTVTTLPVDAALPAKAHAASMVLLKNQRILPIKKNAKVCIIGDIAFEESAPGICLATQLQQLLTARGYQITDTLRGYDLALERSDNMVHPTVEAAGEADVILLFLGLGQQREKTTCMTNKISIPANQQALLDYLADYKRRIIAIAPAEYCPDLVLQENCAAMLLASLHTDHSAQTLADALSGVINPGGKLASTVYEDTDRLYTQHHTYKFRDGLKTGSFIGYRYYDLAQCAPSFPFGHGLSYSNFAYSNLRIADGIAHFTVANRGKRAGAEIAQVYIGKPESAVLRPAKQLAGFLRIELAPGERKAVQIPFSLPAVYDASSGAFVQEEGRYQLWVGASLSQTHLSETFTAGNAQPAPDGLHPSAYIQSQSNIISDHYKLEAKYKTMKKSVFNYIFSGLMLLLAVVLKLYCVAAQVTGLFFDLFALALSAVGIAFLAREAIHLHRARSQARAELDELSRQEFSDTGAENLPLHATNEMFVQEFDTAAAAVQQKQEEGIDGVEANLVAYINKDQDFLSAMDDFTRFAAERGCKFSSETVQELFASLASSRLLVLRDMNDSSFKKFMQVLSSYFETGTYIDRADQYDKTESVLFSHIGGDKAKTNVLQAIEAAKNSKHLAHFAALTHVLPENLPMYFTPFVNHARNPLGHNQVNATNEQGVATSYHLPANLWFVLHLEEKKLPHLLPDYVAEVAAAKQFAFEACSEEAHPVHVPSFSYHQLMFLTERAINKGFIDEAQFRKLDRLEKYVSKYTPFAIPNKAWLCMETYAYVYQACNGQTPAALDQAVCAKLMPLVIAAVQPHLTAEDPTLEESVVTILGEECSGCCKKLIHDCLAKRS